MGVRKQGSRIGGEGAERRDGLRGRNGEAEMERAW